MLIELLLLKHAVQQRGEPVERQPDHGEVVSLHALHERAARALDAVPASLVPATCAHFIRYLQMWNELPKNSE